MYLFFKQRDFDKENKRTCHRKIVSKKAQSTVEAAIFIPIIFVMILLLIQPGIYLYDLIVMRSAAAEGCRVLALNEKGNEKLAEDFVRRRLSAIPQTDIFHMHKAGCSYKIELQQNYESKIAKISIENELKPLPLIDVGCKVLGLVNEKGNLVVSSKETQNVALNWERSL